MKWLYEIYWKDKNWNIDWNNKISTIENTILWEAKNHLMTQLFRSRDYWTQYTSYSRIITFLWLLKWNSRLYLWSNNDTATEWDSDIWWSPVKSLVWGFNDISEPLQFWTDLNWDYWQVVFQIWIWNEWTYNEIWIKSYKKSSNWSSWVMEYNLSRWVWNFIIPSWWAFVIYKIYYNSLLSTDNIIIQWFWLTDFSDGEFFTVWVGYNNISDWNVWVKVLIWWELTYYASLGQFNYNNFNKIQIWTWDSVLSKNDSTLNNLHSSVNNVVELINVRWNWTWDNWLVWATKIIQWHNIYWIFTNLPTDIVFREIWLWSDRSWTETTLLRKLVNIQMETEINELRIDFKFVIN